MERWVCWVWGEGADGLGEGVLGLPQDAGSAAAGEGKAGVLLAEQVTKAQRWKKVGVLNT
mgnify:CR=1 FL=1